MQFVKHGPDIPESLLQAHEDGRVVFFCGAGISYPAQLPDFYGLVDRIFPAVGEPSNALERLAIEAGRYDTAIGLLEARINDGRQTVRRAVANILTPILNAPDAKATHQALLTLARRRDGRTRLITTNFDRLFEAVISDQGFSVPRFQAPLLPVPKSRWSGLVYLHGLLPENSEVSSDLERLVLSSGDFGLAYLIERWASRFVSELFRASTVCFVGYSINDPVLRYMTDALAADRLLGESPPEMYAFGGFAEHQAQARSDEWKAKNVTPILYPEGTDHAAFHETIRAWSRTYRDGVNGKEQIVVDYALARPQTSTIEDNFVGRMLWALSDREGLPAKRFAGNPELDPAPSLDWLEAFTERRFRQTDLNRFGIAPLAKRDSDFTFSLMRRPAPYESSPFMGCAHNGVGGTGWDDVMSHMASWLTRHMDDPKLVLWLASEGPCLHEFFARMVESKLDEFARLEREKKTGQLERIRSLAPNSIPRQLMRTVWQLLLRGLIRNTRHRSGIYEWIRSLQRDGLSASLRAELREILAPRIVLREPYSYSLEELGEGEGERPERLSSLLGWDLVLATDHVHYALRDMRNQSTWTEALPKLLDDFNGLLHNAFDLLAELGAADARNDGSYAQQPSISPHAQNRDFRDWTALIELTRDAWVVTASAEPQRARLVAEGWAIGTYPVFRRLALFAATHTDIVPEATALTWLLSDQAWWLWSNETQREAMRLLVSLGPRLDPDGMKALEHAVLQGPPRDLYNANVQPERWAQIVDREIWEHLEKLEEAKAPLSATAREVLEEKRLRHTAEPRDADQRDEFPVWMGDAQNWHTFHAAPRRRGELVEWLKEHPKGGDWEEDDWGQLCREHLSLTAIALFELARENIWPEARWRQALQAWAEEKQVSRSWRSMAPLVADAPDELIRSLAHSISWWLRSVAKVLVTHASVFLDLCHRVLALDQTDSMQTEEPVTRAINHPVGHVTEALLDWWFQKDVKDGDKLPAEIAPIFSQLCDGTVQRFQHARVLLAAKAIALFRVDRDWAIEHLLPWFEWRDANTEVRGIWEGFLWSPRIYFPFLGAIKSALLETARHYDELGEHAQQYAQFITFIALNRGDTFTLEELQRVLRDLPPQGLAQAAQALARGIEGAGDKQESYWDNRIAPFWRDIWPKARELATSEIADDLARMAIAAKSRFPDAVRTVLPWLRIIEHSDYIVHRLSEAALCAPFPEPSLALLDAIINEASWPARELGSCLDAIERAQPALGVDQRFVRLKNYLRRRGQV